MTSRKIQYWVIPPQADSEFSACMEEVLDTYVNVNKLKVFLWHNGVVPILTMELMPIDVKRLHFFV